MEQILYNNEIAYKTKYLGYYCTYSGKIITIKVKGGRGKLDISSPREHCYKTDKDGYLECCLSINGKHYYKKVHKIIYETFFGDVPVDLTIDHIDNNKLNNNIVNLQLLTRENNSIKRNTNCMEHRKIKYLLDGILYSRNDLFELYELTKDDLLKFDKGIITKRMKNINLNLKKM